MVFIKEEPKDDDLFLPDADALPNEPTLPIKQEPRADNAEAFTSGANVPIASTEPQASRTSNRATAADGRPYNSQCFQKPYLGRPQFHRLKCGHDVVTATIEPCGLNCQPPTYYTGSDQKPDHRNFECKQYGI